MEPLLHFAIPFAFFMLMKVKLKKAFLLSILALTLDLDALFHIHRSISHSAIVLLAIMALIWLFVRKPKIRAQIPLASLALMSHLILDIFAGFTPILWPLSQTSFWIKTELIAYIGRSIKFSFALRLLKEATRFYSFQSLDAPLFTSEGIIIALILFIPVMAKIKECLHKQI